MYTALFHAAIATTVMGLSELIVIGLASYFSIDFTLNQPVFRPLVITSFISKIIYFLIMYLLSILSPRKHEQKNKFDISLLFLIIIPIISSFVMLTLLITSNSFNANQARDLMISLSSVGLIILNILIWILYAYNQKKSNEFTNIQISLQKETDMVEYYKMINQQNRTQNMLIHDIKKHLQSIALLNAKDERDKIDAYIARIISSNHLKTSVRLCNNELLNAILYRYTRQCEENQIDFRLDIRSNTINFLKDDELTSIFCNLIENAIESAVHISNSFIELSVCKSAETGWTVITITNSCFQKPHYNVSGELISSKANTLKHGFGIKSIRRIVNQYCGELQHYYDENTHVFHTIIMLKPSN